MSKGRVGFWLLVSLMPTGLITFIGFIVIIFLSIGANESEEPRGTDIACTFIFTIFLAYWWAALFTGIGLKVWAKREGRQAFNQAQRYAEGHGWHPISQTAWQTLKADGTSLAVSQSVQGTGFTLNISANAGATVVPDFAKPLWALQFGDWLWERTGGENITLVTVEAQRREWSQGLVPINPPRPPTQR